MAIVVAVLALAASASSLGNGFTYDDVYLIQRTPRLHTLDGWWRDFAHTYWPEDAGGDGYRPLTIIAYRLEWAIGGGSPLPFHVANVALHVAGAVAVFWLGCAVLPLAAAWIAALLYAVHPVHVEAVANVVGQSELAVAFLTALSMAVYLHGRLAGPISKGRWAGIFALYATGLLFKEHAIVLPALILLAELTVVRDPATLWRRTMTLRPALLGLTLIAAVYMWTRSAVVIEGLSGFKPFVVFQALQLSSGQRVLTMIGSSHEWVRLFLWPARLMTEYAPPYIEVAQGVSLSLLPGALVLLGILGLAVASWKRSPATAFGIGWLVLMLLPASNFLIPAGFIIAERTLLSPSIGAMIALGSVVPAIYARIELNAAARSLAALAVVVLVGLGLWRSHTRNVVWRDNDTLFRQGVIDAPDSYRAHFMLGVHLFESGDKANGERHYREALGLFPYDPLMALALAEQYRRAGLCKPAIPLYRAMYSLVPDASSGHLGFATCLLETFELEEAKQEALLGIRTGSSVKSARAIILAAKQARDSLDVRAARGDSAAIAVKAAQRRPSR
jgi:hypothetical protein